MLRPITILSLIITASWLSAVDVVVTAPESANQVHTALSGRVVLGTGYRAYGNASVWNYATSGFGFQTGVSCELGSTMSFQLSADNHAPTIQDIVNQSTLEDVPLIVSLWVGDQDGNALTLTATSSDVSKAQNAQLIFGGSGSNQTLTIQPVSNATGTVTITVTVMDPFGLIAQDFFDLIIMPVNDAPTLTSIGTLPGATEDTPFTITYDMLAAASNKADVDSSTVSFRIESKTTGSLSKDGVGVINGAGITLSSGESLVWTPSANANGVLNAFTVKPGMGNWLLPPQCRYQWRCLQLTIFQF